MQFLVLSVQGNSWWEWDDALIYLLLWDKPFSVLCCESNRTVEQKVPAVSLRSRKQKTKSLSTRKLHINAQTCTHAHNNLNECKSILCVCTFSNTAGRIQFLGQSRGSKNFAEMHSMHLTFKSCMNKHTCSQNKKAHME